MGAANGCGLNFPWVRVKLSPQRADTMVDADLVGRHDSSPAMGAHLQYVRRVSRPSLTCDLVQHFVIGPTRLSTLLLFDVTEKLRRRHGIPNTQLLKRYYQRRLQHILGLLYAL